MDFSLADLRQSLLAESGSDAPEGPLIASLSAQLQGRLDRLSPVIDQFNHGVGSRVFLVRWLRQEQDRITLCLVKRHVLDTAETFSPSDFLDCPVRVDFGDVVSDFPLFSLFSGIW